MFGAIFVVQVEKMAEVKLATRCSVLENDQHCKTGQITNNNDPVDNFVANIVHACKLRRIDITQIIFASDNIIVEEGNILEHAEKDPDSHQPYALQLQLCVICRVANLEDKSNQYEESEKVDDIEAQTVGQSQVLECLFAQSNQERLVSIILHLKEATHTDFRFLYWENGINNWKKHR